MLRRVHHGIRRWPQLAVLILWAACLISVSFPGLSAASSLDGATDTAVDNLGNVYVTGYYWNGANTDYFTVKYDTSGNWVWGRRYNGSGDGYDRPVAISVDQSGNIFVTGVSDGATGADYVTIKYDPNGNWLWGRRYNGSGQDYDEPTAISVDGQGNVYVTGYSNNDSLEYDYVTIKYDPNGNWLWGRRYNGSGDGEDEPKDLAVDSSGNVYVTGISFGASSAKDYVTIKYDINGNWLWGQRYNSPANSDDYAEALALDAGGNVYVTGESWNGNFDFVTIKYSTSGVWVWGRRYNGPANDLEHFPTLALDASGNVYVTGSSDNGANWDYVTIKYSLAGTWLWGQRYNSPTNTSDISKDLAVDAGGNVCVTGESWNGYSFDYVTIEYNPSGAWAWGARYNSPTNGDDKPLALTTDPGGNVIVTGHSYLVADDSDFLTIKYDTAGNVVWGHRFSGIF